MLISAIPSLLVFHFYFSVAMQYTHYLLLKRGKKDGETELERDKSELGKEKQREKETKKREREMHVRSQENDFVEERDMKTSNDDIAGNGRP